MRCFCFVQSLALASARPRPRQVLGGAGEDLDSVVLPRQQIGVACPDRLIVIHPKTRDSKSFMPLAGTSALAGRAYRVDAKTDGTVLRIPILAAPIMARARNESRYDWSPN